jgi:hypothetical protein
MTPLHLQMDNALRAARQCLHQLSAAGAVPQSVQVTLSNPATPFIQLREPGDLAAVLDLYQVRHEALGTARLASYEGCLIAWSEPAPARSPVDQEHP